MNRLGIRAWPRVVAIVGALAGLAALAARPLCAQGSVAGQVTDKVSQQPIAGAEVVVVGTSLGARTGRDGRYTITRVPAGQYQVRVRLIGFANTTSRVTVPATGGATLDFALTPAAIPLEAVVVSASGAEQQKRELGNNVPTINAAVITKEALPNNAADLLNSRVPGVEVMQSGGTTGTGSRVRIRGSTSLSLTNEPVIVIDGVRIDNTANSDGNIGVGGQAPSRLNDINPEDIQSVAIVEGPSAAVLYGTDAANGVIQYTTKQGKPGPAQWGGFIEGGTLNDETNWPTNYASVAGTGAQCFLYQSGPGGSCTIAKVNSFNPLVQNTPFREGVRQHYGVNVSGGTDVTTYYVSGDFQREKGIYDNNNLNKTSLRANMRNQLNSQTDLQVSAGYVSSNAGLPQNDNNNQGIISSALLGFPNVFFPDTLNGGYLFLNPSQQSQVSTTQRVERFTGGVTMTYRPWSFLTLRGTGGYDVSHQADDELTPANVVLLSAAQAQGNAFQFRAATFAYTGNFSATASYRPSEAVTTSTTAGLQFYKNVYQQVQASGRSVVAGTAGVSGVVFPTVHDTTAPAVTFGGFVEEAVAVHDRLYITGALRDDHHSAFGTNFKSVLYPKLSASWVIGEEPFFPQLSWLSGLRLRAAWGESGRAPEPIDALQFSAPVAVALQGTDVPGITVGGSGNTNLRPEKTREFEGGFDADLIGQRLHFVATYYDKATTDALVAVPIAGSIGQSATRLANLGRVSNKGIELQLTAQVLNTPNLTWDVTVGAWGNRNRVLSTGPGNTPIIFGLGGASQRLQAGYPAGGYWDVPYTYKDLNGDGIIEPNEITIGTQNAFAGSSQPTQGATLSTDVGFLQHFRVHGLLDGRWGALLDNATEGFRCLLGNCAALALSSMPLADQAAAVARLVYGTEWGYYQDAGFVKLREVSVSYDAPAAWAARVGARTLSFTVSGRNLVTWTNYKGADPELNTTGQDNYRVADFLTQPPVRYFLARVNVTF